MKSLHLGKRTAGNILEVIRLIILAQPAGGRLTANKKPAFMAPVQHIKGQQPMKSLHLGKRTAGKI